MTAGPETHRRYGVPAVPRRFVARARLTDRLDEASDDRLIIIRGVGGSGKSVLVSTWLRGERPTGVTVWVALDRSSAGRHSFWSHVLDSLIDAQLPGGSALEAALPVEEDEVRSHLLRSLSRIEGVLRIVLDNFEVVDAAVEADLAWVIERSDRLRVIVATRRISTLEQPAQAARLDPTVIGGHELAFTAKETVEVVVAAGTRLTEAHALAIHAATQGWPLATRVAISEFATDENDIPAPAVVTAEIARQTAPHFLAEFQGTPDLEFALRTSIALFLTEDLAELLSGSPEAAATLRRFEEAGIVERLRRNGRTVFGYHEVIRVALEQELERRLPREFVALRITLGNWLLEHGESLESLRQFVLADDLAAATRVVAASPQLGLFTQSEVIEILQQIPRPRLRTQPILVIMLALLYNAVDASATDRVRSMADLALALARARMPSASPLDRYWLQLVILGGQRLAGRFDAAATTADRIRTLLDTLPPESLDAARAARPMVANQVGTTYLYAERYDDAIAELRQVGTDVHPWSIVHASSLTALTYTLTGQMSAAAPVLERILAVDQPRGWRGSYNGSGWHIAEAHRRLERWDPVGARAVLNELDRHFATIEHWPLIVHAVGVSLLMERERIGAAERFTSLLASTRRRVASSSARARLSAVHADLLIAAGNIGGARRALANADEIHDGVALSLARLALAEGREQDALKLLDPIMWDEAGRPRRTAEALMLSAVAQNRRHNTDDAQRHIVSALRVMDAHSLKRPLMMVAHGELKPLLAAVDESAAQRLDGVPDPFAEMASGISLTPRERIVLEHLVTESNLDRIAAQLFVSPNTVKSQLRSVYRKLGAKNRHEALVAARRRGLTAEPVGTELDMDTDIGESA